MVIEQIRHEPLIRGEYLDNLAALHNMTRDGRTDRELADAIIAEKRRLELEAEIKNRGNRQFELGLYVQQEDGNV